MRAHPKLTPHARCALSPGHLLEYEFAAEYRKWRSCPEGDLISTAPLEAHVRDKNESLKRMLQTEARAADWLLLWLDCDREGEAICEEVRSLSRALRVSSV